MSLYIGGAIAIATAASKPSIVSSLVVVDSTGVPLGSLPDALLRRSIELPAQLGSVKVEAASKMMQSSFYNSFFNTRNVIQIAKISLEEDLRPILPQIQSPSIILWVANDRFTPLRLGQELALGIKGSWLRVVAGEYQELSMFRPDKFVPGVLDFIDEVERLI